MTRFHSHAGFRIQGQEAGSDESGSQQPPMVVSMRGPSSLAGRLPFASISSSMFGSKPMESSTGIEFPGDVCHKQKPCPTLTGLGVRAKRILGLKNINVYALGIYVDPAAAKKALGSKFPNVSSAADLESNQAMFDEVVTNASFEKSLRLVISFGSLRRSQFLDALQERLEPSLKKEKEPATTMHEFKSMFNDVHFKKGLEIVFVQEGSKLVTKVAGEQKGSIHSPALCRSLFGIYLGPDAVAPQAKTTFGKNLAAAFVE